MSMASEINVPRSFLAIGSFLENKASGRAFLALEAEMTYPNFLEEIKDKLSPDYIEKSHPSSIGDANLSIASGLTISPSEIVVCKYKRFRNPEVLILNGKNLVSKVSPTALSCYDSMKKIDNFCIRVFQKHPVENSSKVMISELKNPYCLNNAAWVPQMARVEIGETDTRIFSRQFAGDEDILSHEFGHAVIQYKGGLRYINESGALNESLADVFAIMRKHYFLKKNANDPNTSWVLAENIFVDENNKKNGLRSFIKPGSAYNINSSRKDLQVDHMTSFKNCGVDEDNGGVHINSGIPNRAFYLAATREQGPSWEKIGKIWFKALDECKNPDVTFSQFATKTFEIAGKKKYGSGIQNIVGQAWQNVGVLYNSYTASRSVTVL